jgi:lactoylglutathione lyase
MRLPVGDLDEALEFYRDRLGHELVWRTGVAAGLALPASEAEIVLQTERPEAEVDLLVDAIQDAIDRFVQAGGTILVEPFEIAIGRCAVVTDPFGNRLVLLDAEKGALETDETGNVTGVKRAGRRPDSQTHIVGRAWANVQRWPSGSSAT